MLNGKNWTILSLYVLLTSWINTQMEYIMTFLIELNESYA